LYQVKAARSSCESLPGPLVTPQISDAHAPQATAQARAVIQVHRVHVAQDDEQVGLDERRGERCQPCG